MRRLSKKILLFLATALFGVSAILGITIVGLKSVKADTTITVSSVSRTYLGYSTSTGTDYVVTFGGCGTTDLLSGIAINAEITSSNAADTYASLRSKIKLNGTVLSSHSTASAKFYKAGTDSVRIHCSATFGYAKFEFLSGLTVGTGSLASDVTFYQNTDATFSTVAPDSRINGVYEFSANRSVNTSLGNTIWQAVYISPTVSSTTGANNGGVFAGILFTGTVGGTDYNRAQMVDTDGNALIPGLIRQQPGKTLIGYNTNYNAGHYEYVIDLDPGVLQTQSITLTFPAGFNFNGKISTPIVKEQSFTIGNIGTRTTSSSYEWYETSHKHELNLVNAKTELINGVSYDVEFNFSGAGYFSNAVSSTGTDIYFTYNSVNETRTGSTGAGQVYGFVKGRSFAANTLNNGSFSIANNASNATFTAKGKTNVLHYSKNLAEYYRNGVDGKYHAVMEGKTTRVMSGYSAISAYSSFALADDNGAGYFGVEWVAGTYTATLTDFKSFDTSGKDLGIYFSNNCTSSTITRYGDAGKTITIKPDESLGSYIGWTVTDGSGDPYALTITNNGDGTYSFVMPDETINIEAKQTVFTVESAELINRQAYSGVSGGMRTEYLITFDAEVDLFGGYENGDEITGETAFSGIATGITYNEAALSKIAGGYHAYKYNTNVLKLVTGKPSGYAKLTFAAGLTLNGYSLVSQKILYLNEYQEFTDVEPEYRPVAVYERPDGSNRLWLALAITRADAADNRSQFAKLYLNGVAGADTDNNYIAMVSYGNDWDAGNYQLQIHTYFANAQLAAIKENGGVLFFENGFTTGSYTTSKAYGFAIEAGIEHGSSAWANLPFWKPINGYADIDISYIGENADKYEYKLSLTNTKGLAATAAQATTNGGADLITNFAQGDDMTAFMARWSSLPSQMSVDGTLLKNVAGVTFEKGNANEIIMSLSSRADMIVIEKNAVVGNAFISSSSDLGIKRSRLNLTNAYTYLINGVDYDVSFSYNSSGLTGTNAGFFVNSIPSTANDIYMSYHTVSQTRTGNTTGGQVYGIVRSKGIDATTGDVVSSASSNHGVMAFKINGSNTTYTVPDTDMVLHYSKTLSTTNKDTSGQLFPIYLNDTATYFNRFRGLSSFYAADNEGADRFGIQWYYGTYAADLTNFKCYDTAGLDLGITFGTAWLDSSSVTRYAYHNKRITIKPENVFGTFNGWKVTDASGNPYDLVITDNGDGTYSFDMPDEEINIVALGSIAMDNGAEVRLIDPVGLGFMTKIDYNFYGSLVDSYGSANVKTGTIIIPTKYAREVTAASQPITFAGLTAVGKVLNTDYIDIANRGFLNEATAATDGYYKFRGSLVNIYESNYNASFSAVGYVAYYSGGEWHYSYTAYSEANNARSVKYVANCALDADVVTTTISGNSKYLIKTAVDYSEIFQKDAASWDVENPRYSIYQPTERAVLVKYASCGEIVGYPSAIATSRLNGDPAQMYQYLHVEFAEWFENATGKVLGITVDPNVQPRYSIGDSTYLSAANLSEFAANTITDDGYVIKRIDKTVYIDGINDRGVIYGVYGFLEKFLGYTFVDKTSQYGTSFSDYWLDTEIAAAYDYKNVTDVAITPYFTSRHYLQRSTAYGGTSYRTMNYQHNNGSMATYATGYGGLVEIGRLTGNLTKDNEVEYDTRAQGNIFHSMEETLRAGIALYNNDNGTSLTIGSYAASRSVSGLGTVYQPCFSSGVTKDTGADVNAVKLSAYGLKELVERLYGAGVRIFSFSVNDTDTTIPYCTCSECTLAKGGANSEKNTLMVMRFVNAVIAEMESDAEFMANYPDFKIYTLAYAFSNTCPVSYSDKFDQRVVLEVCETFADYSKPITDNANIANRTNITNWQAHLDDGGIISVLLYNRLGHNFLYVPTLTTAILDNVKWLHDNGVKYLDVEGRWSPSDLHWDDKLFGYIYSRLMFEFDETRYATDKTQYLQDLVAEYLKAYYVEPAYSYVSDFLWTLQGYYNTIFESYSGLSRTGRGFSEYLTIGQIDTLMGKLDNAITAINSSSISSSEKTVGINRIKEIKLTLMVTVIMNFSKTNYYPSATTAQYDAYVDEFNTLCGEIISHYSGGNPVYVDTSSTVWDMWSESYSLDYMISYIKNKGMQYTVGNP